MIKVNGIKIESKLFPNGETFIDVPSGFDEKCRLTNMLLVTFKFESNQDIWDLIQLMDYLEKFSVPKYLNMSYVPYSRMDRKENDRLFSLKSFAKLINSMNFKNVVIAEPHSDVTPALFDRVIVENTTRSLVVKLLTEKFGIADFDTEHEKAIQQMEEQKICLVYPDAGAEKRYSKQIQYAHCLTANKHRDFNTGKITSLTLNGTDENQDCEIAIIVDDLSSRGNSFIFTAKELRKKLSNLRQIYLCVAHCENAIQDGVIFTTDDIDEVHTTDSLLSEKVKNKKLFVHSTN